MKLNKKKIVLLVSVVMLLTMTVGTTLAYLLDTSDTIENIFNPSEVTCAVTETVTETEKTDVMITNTGDTEAYIRAAIVVNWADGKGNVYGKTPIKNSDYALDLSETGWIEGDDGFYYWPNPVAPNNATGYLIDSVKLADGVNAPAGYALSVEILCSAVQSVPAKAVEDWSNGLYTIGTDNVLIEK